MLPCWVDTPPGIWRVAADLMCDCGSFFISFFFHGGTRSKVVVRSLAEEGWGAFSKKHEVSNPAMLGHPFGQAASLSAAAESLLCFSRKLGSSGFYIFFLMNAQPSPQEQAASDMSQKGLYQTAVPTLHYQVTLWAWVLKAFSRLRTFIWMKFPLHLPTSLLLRMRSWAVTCLKKILTVKWNLTRFAVILTKLELSHKVSDHILLVLRLVLSATSYCYFWLHAVSCIISQIFQTSQLLFFPH